MTHAPIYSFSLAVVLPAAEIQHWTINQTLRSRRPQQTHCVNYKYSFSVDVLLEGFTVYTVNVSECKYRAGTNYSFPYWVICSEKCPSENLIWKLPTQCPSTKTYSLPVLSLTENLTRHTIYKDREFENKNQRMFAIINFNFSKSSDKLDV